MSIIPKSLKGLRIPNIQLNGKCLKFIHQKKYLRVLFTEDTKDNLDMARELRSVYCRGNILLRRFKKCREDIKLDLFKSYCTQLYCNALWCNYKRDSINKLRVAYNNTFRLLFNVRGIVSISNIYMNVGLDTIDVLLRKSMYSLYTCIKSSSNSILQAFFRSSFFVYKSHLHKHWKEQLYVH